MGLFDVFTGAPAKRAAEENSARFGQLQTQGMGFLDTGLNNATGALDTAGQPLAALGSKYGAATTMGLNALGVNGVDAQNTARQAYAPSPGLEYAKNAAVDVNDRRMASRGLLGSGNNIDMSANIAGEMQYNDYNSWLSRLMGASGQETTAATGLAGLGTARAGLYQGDAGQRVGLASNVVNGQNSQTTQAANAEMAGSGNLWNFGLQLANLGAGAAGGGGMSGGTPSVGNTQGGYGAGGGSGYGMMGGVRYPAY